MEKDVLKKIKTNDRNQIKYYRTLVSADEIALNISALANSGGGNIIFGVKDNYSYLEIKGIASDYKLIDILNNIKIHLNGNDIFQAEILKNEEGKVILNVKVNEVKRKIAFKERIYIMSEDMNPIKIKEKIFISHSSVDRKYGEALVKLLRGLGFQRQQIIFTSNDDYGIPIDTNIFDYLKSQINDGVYMIYLLSDNYYKSVACLNEMGAAWIVQNEYTVIGVPDFNFNNPKFSEGAIDPRRIGFNIDNRKRIVEFKNKLLDRFELSIDEVDWNNLLDEYLNTIL
ncbi:MAG: hypothetical protein K0R54_3631 [Clostridiaceae bacterium]|jgi:hypothetical protein|nr:hypothetical protein [Clostridiaceae bacterium]